MATLLSTSDGNFTSSSTWSLVDPSSFLDSVVTGTVVTVSPANSSIFTPGAITVSGIALQVYTKTLSPSGTFTVQLWNSSAGSAVSGTTVVVNVTDFATINVGLGQRGIGWMYFKFDSPVTLLAATNYAVRTNTSVSNQITLYASTGTNWSRAIVTTTVGTPAASDTLIICGSYTNSSSSTVTVTMNSTSSATSYGTIYISEKGTLTYGTTGSTNYILRLSGNMFVTRNGSLIIGTSSTPIPETSTARLEFNVASNAQYGLYISGGNFTTYGSVKTTGVTLGADASAGATSITLSSLPTGWKNGNTLLIPSTTTTAAQAEIKNLSADVTTTTASIAALTNAHGGNSTTLVQADVLNLTRNVVITVGATTTLVTFVQICGYLTTVDCKYTSFLQCGSSVAGTSGLGLFNVTGGTMGISVDIQYCSLYQTTQVASSLGFYIGTTLNSTVSSTYTFSNNVCYNFGSSPIIVQVLDGVTNPIWESNYFVRSGTSGIYDWRGSNSNNVFTSSTTTGITLYVFINANGVGFPSSDSSIFSNWKLYGNAGYGISIATNTANAISTSSVVSINGWRIWRNAAGGLAFSTLDLYHPDTRVVFNSVYIFGHPNYGIYFNGTLGGRWSFESCYFWSGTTQTTPYCIGSASSATGLYVDALYLNNCTFGRDYLGNTSNFTTAILNLSLLRGSNIIIYNPTFSGTVAGRSTAGRGFNYSPSVQVFKENGVTGSNSLYANYGTVSTDSSIYKTLSPSFRLAPFASGYKCPSSTVRVPVGSGESCTITTWVRRSVAGDGSAYNGNQPRLVYRYNPLAGNNTVTIGATGASAGGMWEQLTYTTPSALHDCVMEFYIDCDGTAGWINIDDWDTNLSNDSRGGKYWAPYVTSYSEPSFSIGSGSDKSYTFIT